MDKQKQRHAEVEPGAHQKVEALVRVERPRKQDRWVKRTTRDHAYDALSVYYDLIYAHKNYAQEAAEVSALIQKLKNSDGNVLLDVACGTGRHLEHLRDAFSCTGLDLSQAMLDIARQRLDGVELLRADMSDFRIRKQFDAIICMFGAIAYARTHRNLERVINNLYAHLKPGGVLIIERWYDREQWISNPLNAGIYGTGDLKIVRIGYNRTKGNIALSEEHYLIAEKGRGVRYFSDVQQFGLFTTEEFMHVLSKCGFKPSIMKSPITGNPRYVAVKSV